MSVPRTALEPAHRADPRAAPPPRQRMPRYSAPLRNQSRHHCPNNSVQRFTESRERFSPCRSLDPQLSKPNPNRRSFPPGRKLTGGRDANHTKNISIPMHRNFVDNLLRTLRAKRTTSHPEYRPGPRRPESLLQRGAILQRVEITCVICFQRVTAISTHFAVSIRTFEFWSASGGAFVVRGGGGHSHFPAAG